MVKRLTTSLILAFFGIIALFFLLPWQTLAQECGEPSEHYLIDNFEIVTNVDPGLIWSRDGNDWDLNCDHFNCNNLDSSGLRATIKAPYFGTLHTGDTLYLLIQRHTFNNGTHLRGRLELSNGEIITGTWTALNTDWITVGVSSENDGDQLSAIYLDATTFGSAFDESFTFLVDQSYFLASCNVQPGVLCPLVGGADFLTDDAWLLTDGASITTGTLSLPVDGVAAQNLTLTSNRTYNAVISTTAVVSGTANLTIRLGTQSQSQEISAAGEYTFTFTTATLGGPVAYIIENTGPDAIDLDFTCVSLFSSGSGQGECLQPTNGTFETADNWTYYRSASWFSPAKKANLPHTDAGLIESTPVFTFPSIGVGEYLLLGFTAIREGSETAYVGNRGLATGGGAIVVTSTYEVYPQEYQYEIDYTDLASATSGSISFVNPGSAGYEGVTSSADFKVDNVCVFIATRPPNLPTPLDPDGISPVDLGFNYTSCDDVDGLLAGFGVNIQQYRAEYEAGPSLWDPIGWVPWLVAAIWNALALYLCVFMAAFVTLVDILEYLINNFLNIASWLIRSWPVFVQWLLSVWAWLLATLPNVLAWLGDTIVLGLTWFFLSGGNLFVFTFFMLGYFIQAALDFLNWLGFDLPDNLLDLLLNGLIGIANLFITAWNLFLPAVEFVISGIVNFWVGLWNMLAPFFSAVWSYISGGSLPLLLLNPLVYLVLAVFNLVWMLILWVWANVFMVVNIPIQFYYAFDTGVRGEAFASLIACASENFWCQMLAGVQLVNQTSAHSIGYPIVIVGIIVGSLVIFWEYIWALFHTEIS